MSSYAAVIPLWMKSLLHQDPCYINGNGLYTRDFCYVEDIVQANIKAALCEYPQAYGDVFNIAFGKKTTLLELYTLIRDYVGVDLNPLHRENRRGDVEHSHAHIEKARDLLGYAPLYSLENGLKITIDWFQKNLSGDLYPS